MNLLFIKKCLLIFLNAFLVYYLLVAGVNLAIRFTSGFQSTCDPVFCSEIINEDQACLISTPGSESCLKIAGHFVVLSPLFAFSLFGLSLFLGYYFSKRFYLSRILIVILFFASILFFIRLLIGSVELSFEGILIEFNKLGLNPPIFNKISKTLFQMFNPKF